MLNPFVLRKYMAILIISVIGSSLFTVGLLYYGILGGVIFFGVGLVCSLIVGNIILSHPFTKMLEGKGILVINIDSTGILQPFIVGVKAPYMVGKLRGKWIKDVFDRSAVSHLAVPHQNSKTAKLHSGGITIELDEREFNEARFGMFHYPVILYNEQIGSVITKDFLSEMEKDTFAEHGVLYLNRKMEELTSVVRDFGRHIVDTLKPAGNILQNKWTWVVLAIMIIIFAVLFGKPIMNAVSNFSTGAGGAFSSAAGSAGGGAITPQ